MRTFRSDNNAGLCPEALAGITCAADGSHRVGYGDDEFTAEAVDAFRAIFGKDAAVFFVATGTAANTLAIASLTRPWQDVICHINSHCNSDESTAPERIAQCRIAPIFVTDSKLTPDDVAKAARKSRGDVHQPQPGVLTISNPTEFGTVYTPTEVRALCEVAHGAGYRVHMDGARFANAVAHLQCDSRELTVEAGVDALSFGGTKNGLALGEAVLLFRQDDGAVYEEAVRSFPFHRMSHGHLLSKHRFLAAPFTAVLRDGAWLRHASHANAMAQFMEEGLRALSIEPAYEVESNGVFVALPREVNQALARAGHGYYQVVSPRGQLARLMCSFDTTEEDVRRFTADLRRALGDM